MRFLERELKEIIDDFKGYPGVVTVDHIEGDSNLMLLVEENSRERLNNTLFEIIESVDDILGDSRFWIVKGHHKPLK